MRRGISNQHTALSNQLSAISVQPSGRTSGQLSAISLQLLDKARQHSFDIYHVSLKAFVGRSAEKTKIVGEQQVILELASRTHGDLKKASKFCVSDEVRSRYPQVSWRNIRAICVTV